MDTSIKRVRNIPTIANHKWILFNKLYEILVIITYDETVENNLKIFPFFYLRLFMP